MLLALQLQAEHHQIQRQVSKVRNTLLQLSQSIRDAIGHEQELAYRLEAQAYRIEREAQFIATVAAVLVPVAAMAALVAPPMAAVAAGSVGSYFVAKLGGDALAR